VKEFHSQGKIGPNWGSKWTLQMIELTGIIPAFHHPFRSDLDMVTALHKHGIKVCWDDPSMQSFLFWPNMHCIHYHGLLEITTLSEFDDGWHIIIKNTNDFFGNYCSVHAR
jgi:hypothetical protein